MRLTRLDRPARRLGSPPRLPAQKAYHAADSGESDRHRPARPLRVGILPTNNFTLNALSSFVDVLRLAADEGDRSRPIRCQWHIMSHMDEPIRSSSGLSICPTSRLLDPSDLDYIVVVGGLLNHGPQIDQAVRRYLLDAGRTSTGIVGLCTGSFVLFRLGLLEGRKCCISWFHYRDFVEEFGNAVPVADQLFVVDGNRITCSGGAGVAYLAAFLVDRHIGSSSAQKALHIMQIDRMQPGSTVQPAPPAALAGKDNRISRALLMMEQNLASPVPVSKIAVSVETSTRQLERVFKAEIGRSPQAAYLRLRLEHARWMLGSPVLMATIAMETGFSDSAHFAKTFKAAFGITPSEQRRQLNPRSRSAQVPAIPRIFDPAADRSTGS